MKYDTIIIGGGASGIVSAITASKRGRKVLILEKNDRIGKKILASGNGKCNLASSLPTKGKYNTPIVEQVFCKIGLEKILAFFDEIGLAVRLDEDRYYPYSEQASSVVNILRNALEKQKVDVLTAMEVEEISYTKGSFFVKCNSKKFESANVVFATGSQAGFGTDSLALLNVFGHNNTPRYPSLVPVLTETDGIKGLKGIRTNAKISLVLNGKVEAQTEGEILFKDNGLSGTAVFTLSTFLARNYQNDAEFVIDFVPEIDEVKLSEEFNKKGLQGFFHKELANNIVNISAKKDNNNLAYTAKNYKIRIKGLSNITLAQVMSGGIDNSEVDFNTMQSKLQKGLFITGEALDVDGECGGFNLMWAWSSGILAGQNI